jgi:hypothetical protein
VTYVTRVAKQPADYFTLRYVQNVLNLTLKSAKAAGLYSFVSSWKGTILLYTQTHIK